MNTYLLFVFGLTIGILITLTIVSHVNDRSDTEPSMKVIPRDNKPLPPYLQRSKAGKDVVDLRNQQHDIPIPGNVKGSLEARLAKKSASSSSVRRERPDAAPPAARISTNEVAKIAKQGQHDPFHHVSSLIPSELEGHEETEVLENEKHHSSLSSPVPPLPPSPSKQERQTRETRTAQFKVPQRERYDTFKTIDPLEPDGDGSMSGRGQGGRRGGKRRRKKREGGLGKYMEGTTGAGWTPGTAGDNGRFKSIADTLSQEFSSGSNGKSSSSSSKGGDSTSSTSSSTSKGKVHTMVGGMTPTSAVDYTTTSYHKQSLSSPASPITTITYDNALKKPDMSLQKASFEKEDLKLHLCNAVFEAYSASYLTTKQHMLTVKSEGYNLTWVNCEMASFIHMRESRNFVNNAQAEGMIMQSLDVLDFSVIHLSTYERSSKRYMNKLWTDRKERAKAWHNIDPVKQAANTLENINNPKKNGNIKVKYSKDASRTLVVMPFLGGAMGAGHSELGNRFEYLKACFWSFYEFIPNIVAGVSRQEDVDWAWKESGLPFYDIILIDDLPKSAGLPVGTTQQVKKRLQSGVYDFDYIFFTESDQILISRYLPNLYDHLKKYPERMILPHRLMVYSDRVMKEVHQRDLNQGINAWMTQTCCMPRQNCAERKTWKSIKEKEVAVINYHGLHVPLGNVNFLDEKYRHCTLGDYKEYCD